MEKPNPNQKKNWFLQNSANMITVSGLIGAIWLTITAIAYPDKLWLILIIAGAVGLTDLLDGLVAKRLQVKSVFGGALDRLRDKVFIGSMLVILAHRYWFSSQQPAILLTFTEAIIILILVIELFLFVMCVVGLFKQLDVSSNQYGRKKMFCQFIVVMTWLISLALEKQFNFPLLNFSIYFIDFTLLITTYYAVKSLEGYFQRYKI